MTTCTVCHRDVAPWDAHIRSVMFEQVAWCGPCWDVRALIPAQRVAESERVAR